MNRNRWQRWNRGGSGLRCLRNREDRDGERDEEEARGFFHEARRVERSRLGAAAKVFHGALPHLAESLDWE